MKTYILLILMLAINCLAGNKTFNTFALCTYVNDIQYCAVNSANVTFSYDSALTKYSLISTNNEVYTYDIVNPIETMERNGVTYSTVTEQINGTGDKPYIAIESEHMFVLVDNLTNCYIKQYYAGTKDMYKASIEFVEIDVVDFIGFYSKCLNNLMENY